MLTKLDIAAIRGADAIAVHLNRTSPNGLVRLIKRNKPSEREPFAQDIEYILDAPVGLETLRGRAELERGHVECFALTYPYHNQHTTVSALLRQLRAGDEIRFSFYPDAHTNGYCAMAGLHGDALYLHVRRDDKRIGHWELDTSTCPSNSARMCRGIPNSEDYARQADEARKVA